MTCQDLQPRAAGIASLPSDDPERVAAAAHAASCGACARSLRQGEALVSLVERAAPLPAPSEASLARAASAVHALWDAAPAAAVAVSPAATTVAPPRGAASPSVARGQARVLAAAAAAAVLVTAAGFVAARPRDPNGKGWAPTLLVTGLASLSAATAATLARVVLAAIAVVSAAFSFVNGGAGDLASAHGLRCSEIELAASLVPLALVGIVAWRSRRGASPAFLGAVAAAGALAAQAALNLRCPSQATSHLLAFHTGGVLVALMAGVAVSRLPAMRQRSTSA